MAFNDWKDPSLARRWSADPAGHNPIRVEHLDLLLALLDDHYAPGKLILDLGFGSGIVEEMIFQRIPGAVVVGVDASPAMMALARERLQPYQAQLHAIEHDLAHMETLALPAGDYQIVIASQTLHHLTSEQMQQAYRAIHHILEPGGLFLLLDRVSVDKPALFDLYRTIWRRLDRLHGTTVSAFEGATYSEHVRLLADDRDQPVSLETHLAWLGAAGFAADCLHCHGHRAFIAARKV